MGRPKSINPVVVAGKKFGKTKSAEGSGKSPFKNAIAKCSLIKNAYMPGLSALKGNSKHVKPADPKLVAGSVDIDDALKIMYPNESRWDYVVGYSDEAFFIEVHPAGTSNVSEMVNKVKWLKNWLASSAPDLNKLHKSKVYYWIPSGGVSILSGSVQYKRIAANNLHIQKPLPLP
ncbi:MAG: hypothetical protein K2K25_00875 [Muribaculaceae bacterium]|nr:hypothetical protein [Muribaculaceae bacterium]